MSFTILGLGTALPADSCSQARAAELTSMISGHDAGQARRLSAIYRRTGIATRHIALLDQADIFAAMDGEHGPSTRWRMNQYEELIPPLACQASARAVADSGVAPGEITHLVTVSCTGFASPGFDFAVMRELGLSDTVQRTHVGFMGCHGALNGLRVARALAESDPSARVLLCAAELCSAHFQYGFNAELAVSNALFADGSAAVVGRSGPADSHDTWAVAANGACWTPGTDDAMTWGIGDHGFLMTLSPRVATLIGERLRPWLSSWLDSLGLSIADVASWAVHPGGPRILDTVEEALGLGPAALAESRHILNTCGNMSSPTILFILDRLRRAASPRPCVAMAFGPGLAIEAALLT